MVQINRFAQKSATEQALYDQIYEEVIDLYGYDVRFCLREVISRDLILNDDTDSRFKDTFVVPAYIENVDEFEGEGNLLSKFGFEMRDEATFVISRTKWHEIYTSSELSVGAPADRRPFEGDLIYLPLSKSFFEISHVEFEQPFYQINDLPAYRLHCSLFEYAAEDFDTGIDDIDVIEENYNNDIRITVENPYHLTHELGTRFYQPIRVDAAGDIHAWNSIKLKQLEGDFGNTLVCIDSQVYSVNDEESDYENNTLFVASTNRDYKTYLYPEIRATVPMDDTEILKITEVSYTTYPTDIFAQNENFDSAMADVIDYTETNPFSE